MGYKLIKYLTFVAFIIRDYTGENHSINADLNDVPRSELLFGLQNIYPSKYIFIHCH